MSSVRLARALLAWLLLTAIGCVAIVQLVAIDSQPAPPLAARRWTLAALESVRTGAPSPAAPTELSAYRAAGPVLVELFHRGEVVRRERGGAGLVDAITAVAARLSADASLRAHPGFAPGSDAPIEFVVTVPLGEGPLLDWLPGLGLFGLVPLVEGVSARAGDRTAYLSPHAVWAADVLDHAIDTPIPDLSFGTDFERLRPLLAGQLGLPPGQRPSGLRRFRAVTYTRSDYPGDDHISAQVLGRAVREGVAFLARHQLPDGRYLYRYDARRGGAMPGGYSLARHAGTAFFLAQAADQLGLPEAREAAFRGLRWVQRRALRDCGEHRCVGSGRVVTLGATALTALAAAQYQKASPTRPVAALLEQLTGHIRAMQRPDGELMHDYDRKHREPIDRQHMYYSGEAAFALLRAYTVTGDERDLSVVRGLMGHLTGSGWSFFGSRYFYGEEHWTCQAAGAAVGHLPVDDGLDFCLRWLAWQRNLQYRAGETPWPATGSYGVGPVLLPRITAVASRVEAGVPIYRAARARGDDVAALRTQLEASVRALLRFRWAPGPVHLMADPAAALGGFPATQASFEVRNDFVQHAGSALLAWLSLLQDESGPGQP